MADKKRMFKRTPAKESSLADDLKAIAGHFGLRSREAEAKHGGKTIDEAVDAKPKGRVLKSGGGYDASSGPVEHAQNKATSPDSPGGERITAEERAMIRAVAQRVLKGG